MEEVDEEEENRGWGAAEGDCLVVAVDAVVVAAAGAVAVAVREVVVRSDTGWVTWGETDKVDGGATDSTDVGGFLLVLVTMSLPLLPLMLNRA